MSRHTITIFTTIVNLISMVTLSCVSKDFNFAANSYLSGYKFNEGLISELKAESILVCTQRCIEHQCKALTFDNTTKTCRTHAVEMCSTTNSIVTPTMSYYSQPLTTPELDCIEFNCTGISTLKPNATTQFTAKCETTWTVFQYRQDGSVDFYRNWEEYKHFFGDLNGEFWLGNDNIHALTSLGPTELMIEMTTSTGVNYYARYSSFNVGSEASNYKLTVSGYSGDAGDSMSHHNGAEFSTSDRDNDKAVTNCSSAYNGCWWYQAGPLILCYKANLNGPYGPTGSMYWYGVSRRNVMTSTKMKLRRRL